MGLRGDDDSDLDPNQLLQTAVYKLRDDLKRGIRPDEDLSQLCSNWSNPILFDHINTDVVEALVDILIESDYPAMVVYQAIQLIQSHLFLHMQNVARYLDALPPSLKLTLLSSLCVASEPRAASRSLLWSSVHKHIDLVAPSITSSFSKSQEAMEIIRFYAFFADQNVVDSVMAESLIKSGIWRHLCCNWANSQLQTGAVLAGLRSARLADYFSRSNMHVMDNLKSSEAMAIAIALSLHGAGFESWMRLATGVFSDLINQAFSNPNALIQVLDMMPNYESFRCSYYSEQLKRLRSSIRTDEGGPDSKTAKRLNRVINAKLKTMIKSD